MKKQINLVMCQTGNMKIILKTIIITTILISCNINPKPFPDCKDIIYSSKEKNMILDFEKLGIKDVEIDRYNFNFSPKTYTYCENYNGVYSLSSYNSSIDLYNDSLTLVNYVKNKTIYIYKNILNDTLRYYTPCFEFNFSSYETNQNFKNGAKFYGLVLKEDIEKYLGYSLQKKGDKFIKSKIKKISYLNICLNDSCGVKFWK